MSPRHSTTGRTKIGPILTERQLWHTSLYDVICQDKYTEAEPLYARCQAICEKALGVEHPHVATALNNRAGSLRAQVRENRCLQIIFEENILNHIWCSAALFTAHHGTCAETEPL